MGIVWEKWVDQWQAAGGGSSPHKELRQGLGKAERVRVGSMRACDEAG